MLTKEEFVKAAQGNFENDNTNLWVTINGIQANVSYDHPETKPFENSERFDDMPLDEAMNNDTFEELYQDYLDQVEE